MAIRQAVRHAIEAARSRKKIARGQFAQIVDVCRHPAMDPRHGNCAAR